MRPTSFLFRIQSQVDEMFVIHHGAGFDWHWIRKLVPGDPDFLMWLLDRPVSTAHASPIVQLSQLLADLRFNV